MIVLTPAPALPGLFSQANGRYSSFFPAGTFTAHGAALLSGMTDVSAQLAADKKAAKQAFDEFMQQEKFRIQDEDVQVLSAGQVLSEDWIFGFNIVFQCINHDLNAAP